MSETTREARRKAALSGLRRLLAERLVQQALEERAAGTISAGQQAPPDAKPEAGKQSRPAKGVAMRAAARPVETSQEIVAPSTGADAERNDMSILWRVTFLAERYGRMTLTLEEVSEQIGLAPNTIRNRRAKGEFKWFKTDGRSLYADVADVAA